MSSLQMRERQEASVNKEAVRELSERIGREDPNCEVLGSRVYHDRHHRPDYVIDVMDKRTGRRFVLYSVEDWEEQRQATE